MTISRVVILVVIVTLNLLHGVVALYEDQVGTLDWHLSLLGRPTSIDWRNNDTLLLIHSNQVVGAINSSQPSEPVWRYVYPRTHSFMTSISCNEDVFVVLSTPMGILVQSLDPATGTLTAQVMLNQHIIDPTVIRSGLSCGDHQTVAMFLEHQVIIIRHPPILPGPLETTVWAQDISVQSIKWNGSNLLALVHHDHHLVLLHGTPENKPTRIILTPLSRLHSAHLGGCSKITWIVLQDDDGLHYYYFSSLSNELMQIDSTINLESYLGSSVYGISVIPNSCFIQVSTDQTMLIIHLDSKQQTLIFQGEKSLQVAHIPSTHHVLLVYPHQIISTDDTDASEVYTHLTIRNPTDVPFTDAYLTHLTESYLVTVTQDGNIHLYHHGKHLWTRYEGLTSIHTAYLIDYPEPKSWEEQEVDVGFFMHWFDRWYSHWEQLFMSLNRLARASLLSDIEPSSSNRQFGFKKVLFLATRFNSLVAVDIRNGNIIWQRYIPSPILETQLQRPTSGSDPARVSISTHEGWWIVDPFTGKTVDSNEYEKDDRSHSSKPMYKYQIRGLTIQGYQRFDNTDQYIPTYNITLKGDTLVDVALPHQTAVASAGRVLGDRTVLYKVLNNNYVAIATQSNISTLRVYFFDISLGRIIGQFAREDVDFTQPIHLLRYEHWAVVIYWNKGVIGPVGWTLTIMEMLETDAQVVSQLGSIADPLPTIHIASYGIPIRDTIKKISVTKTRNGVTIPDIIILTSRSLITISRRYIDALRVHDPNKINDSNIIPYTPILPIGIEDHNVISHLCHIMSNELLSKETDLESTSVVCSYGFDMFCTRVMPSGAFDQLSDTFAKRTLILTCMGLFVASLFMREVLKRSTLQSQWK